MASVGPNSPGTLADDAAVGDTAWSNPSNAASSDNARATSAIGVFSSGTHYLKTTNFGFAIPGGASIDGIVVEIEKSEGTFFGTCVDNVVKIIKGGTISGTNLASGLAWNAGSDVYTTYGSSSNLWGLSWTASDINASNFGVAISAIASDAKTSPTFRIDHIRITIYYTPGGGGSPQTDAILFGGN